MSFIPAPNTVRICLQFVWASQIVEFCLAFLKNSAPSEADIDDLVTALEVWRVDEFRLVSSADLVAFNWYATLLTTSTSLSKNYPVTANEEGAGPSPSVPNNVTLVTTFGTALRGRSYRGRVYLPGMPDNYLNSTTSVSAGTALAVSEAWAQIPFALPVSWSHVVVSYQNNNVLRTTAARTPVTFYRTEQLIDSQRRRLAGRGS